MKCSFPEDSRTLIIAAVILSCTLTKDRSADDIARMAAFFTLVGDTLALMALHPGLLSASADAPACPEAPDAFPCGLSPSENHPSRLSQCSSTPHSIVR